MDQKLLSDLRELVEIQGRKGNYDCDTYMLGMFNGMELMLATIEGREPEYKEVSKFMSVEANTPKEYDPESFVHDGKFDVTFSPDEPPVDNILEAKLERLAELGNLVIKPNLQFFNDYGGGTGDPLPPDDILFRNEKRYQKKTK